MVETESGNDVTTRSLKDRRKLVEECSEICEVLQQHFAPLIGEVEHRVGRETSRTFSPMCVGGVVRQSVVKDNHSHGSEGRFD